MKRGSSIGQKPHAANRQPKLSKSAKSLRQTGISLRLELGPNPDDRCDVRHKGLLNALHASVQLYRADGDMSIAELRRRVETAAARDKELAVDPEFFVELAARHPRLTRAHIMPKLAPYDNELSRFRYDVTLDVVGEAGIHPTSQHFRPNGFSIGSSWHISSSK